MTRVIRRRKKIAENINNLKSIEKVRDIRKTKVANICIIDLYTCLYSREFILIMKLFNYR